MANNGILSNFRSLFNIELAKRLFSVIIFVPLFIYALYQGGVILFSLFIFLFIMILKELVNIFKLSNFKIGVAMYMFLAIYTLVLSPFYYFSLDNNFLIFAYILLSLWTFDTFSYLGGNLFQGKKIFPKLSKGKTYSGSFTGLMIVLIFNFFLTYYIYNKIFFNLFILAFLICVLSFIGDAIVSFIKRRSDLKDTGNLFIGHGGFLDRMDSFIFVFFFFIVFDIHILIIHV
ncbi:MAG: phosphatidate cytidylyltransferase [Candidatus Pelagibacterales bacterium]